MVVSDKNAKWKGEPIPSEEEEAEGHWYVTRRCSCVCTLDRQLCVYQGRMCVCVCLLMLCDCVRRAGARFWDRCLFRWRALCGVVTTLARSATARVLVRHAAPLTHSNKCRGRSCHDKAAMCMHAQHAQFSLMVVCRLLCDIAPDMDFVCVFVCLLFCELLEACAGVVCQIGENPVIGIALDAKLSEQVGTVKTLCFVGLNAMTRHCKNYRELFDKGVASQSRCVKIKAQHGLLWLT